MPDHKKRNETILFNYETTAKTDYRDGEITAPVPTTYKAKGSCARVRPAPLKDLQAMTDWHVPNIVPFDLFGTYVRPKPIVGTKPDNIQRPYDRPKDYGREEAQKTRPRLVMTPAVSMDDIDDSGARNCLCEDMYFSTSQKALGEAISPYFSVKAPIPDLPAISRPIFLPQLKQPVVSPEWRMESVEWDNKQLRSYCNPTRDFWLRHRLNECRACEETKVVANHRKTKTRH